MSVLLEFFDEDGRLAGRYPVIETFTRVMFDMMPGITRVGVTLRPDPALGSGGSEEGGGSRD